MRADGIASREIAARLGVTRAFVKYRFEALGAIRKRPPREGDVALTPFAQLSIYHQRTLRRLKPEWFL